MVLSAEERKQKRAALWHAWWVRHPRTQEQKREKAARARQWRKDNPELSAKQARERYKRDPQAMYEKVKKWRQEHPEQWRKIQRTDRLRRYYGISLEEYDLLLTSQGAKCAVCGGTDPKASNGTGIEYFAVDHDHNTGAVRGLLCNPCNSGLGGFRDDPALLSLAVEYLKSPPGKFLPDNVHAYRPKLTGKDARKRANRAWYLKFRYGITLSKYEALFSHQNGTCAICGIPENASKHRLAVDHDHTTEVVRGLLCFQCNIGIGSFRDNLELFSEALHYLSEFPRTK